MSSDQMLATLIIPRQQTAPPPSQPSKISRQAFPSIQTSRHLCPCLVCVINLSRYISLHQDFQNQLQVRSQKLKSAQCSKVTKVTSKKFNNSSEPQHPWEVVQVENGNHCDLTRPGWGRWWSAPTGPYRHHSSSLWRREMLRKIGV